MPRGKSFRRSLAARKREAGRQTIDVDYPRARDDSHARCGTGYRHAVQKWPVSSLSGKCHKLVIPPECPDKKFVLVVGDSHLRAIADGFVAMPEGRLSFGVMSTPGGAAREERIELVNASIPRAPEAVVLLAPSNNLTSSRTIQEAGADFTRLLFSAASRWSNVAVLDFPPRLNVDVSYQHLLREEFRSAAARMGIRWFPAAEHFPLDDLQLWARDGIHLSDDEGMPILAQLLWQAAYVTLESEPQSSAVQTSPPTRPVPAGPRVVPRIVVKVEDVSPHPPVNPFQWTVLSKGRKRNLSGEPPVCPDEGGKMEMDEPVLPEVTIPLTPMWFSTALLVEMEKLVPSHLPSPAAEGEQRVFVERKKRARVSRPSPPRQRETRQGNVEVTARRSPLQIQKDSAGDEAAPVADPVAAVVDTPTTVADPPEVVAVEPSASPVEPGTAVPASVESTASHSVSEDCD